LVKIPVLGVVPSIDYELRQTKGIIAKIKKKYFAPQHRSIDEDRYVRLISHYEPRSSIAEAYRNIHTNLKLNSRKKTLLITSAGPAEGKSSVVTNLGIVMAQTGLKTLIVSTDLRKPVLAKTFGVKKEPGLTEVVTKAVDLESALNNITDIIVGDLKFEEIRKTPGIENISILSSGHIPSNPVEILESKEIPGIIETLRNKFDVIIFDAPPVLPVTDASLLALKVDSVIIVHEIGKTSRDALLRTKIQLETVGAKLSGIILNHINPQTEAITTYPYYSHYKYRYYGKPEDDENPGNGNNQKKKA
jgi:tyrosine-protein kinase Etk/Wzc